MTAEPLSDVELLAPAGDHEALRAAVASGADAVYFGLDRHNARHRATNFTLDELPEVMQFLHDRNVRGYVTCNTLVFSSELDELARYIGAICQAGVDAVIVQDLGLVRLIRALAPDLPIHGSTQMTLTEPRGLEFVRGLGVERAIVARELSIDDILTIRRESSLPIEVFVHGALCVAYSGQCLTSEALGGRSANRGQCAQACRLPYELIVDGQRRDLGEIAYLLSPQDLAGYEQVGALVEAGVSSLKIEGRLKSAQYVAATTTTYRTALDQARRGEPFTIARQDELDLRQSFSRGFAPGFLAGVDHQRLVEGRFPKSRGVRLGTVVGIRGSIVIVELNAEHDPSVVKRGDGIVFDEGHPDQDEQGGRIVDCRLVGERRVELNLMEGSIQPAAIATGALVWKTDDPDFRRRMERRYADTHPVRRERIDFSLRGTLGGPVEIEARRGNAPTVSARWEGPLSAARNQPTTLDMIREQLGRLGETPFELGHVACELPANVMLPKSVLNQLRRDAVDALLAERQRRWTCRQLDNEAPARLRRAVRDVPPVDVPPQPRLQVLVRNLNQLAAVLAWRPSEPLVEPEMIYCDFEDLRRYHEAVSRARDVGRSVGVATLRIHKPHEEGLLRLIAKCGADAILVRHLAALEWFRAELPNLPLIGDFSLNITNELTAALFRERGLARLTPGYDLNWEQLVDLLRASDPSWYEVVVHQHMPMFHMEHCVFAHTLSNGKDHRDCGRPCDVHRVALRDRVGAELPLLADTGCRNTVFNSVPQSAAEYLPRLLSLGVRRVRVELLQETTEQVVPLLERYARVLAGLDDGRDAWRGLQILHQLGVTRGTLEQA